MKTALATIFLVFAKIASLAQSNYYTFNTDSVINEKRVQSVYTSTMKTLPPNFTITPTIYHRVQKKDSVINYLTFVIEKCNPCLAQEFKPKFEQDSLFLLLGKKLPKFNLQDLEGNEFSSDQLKGKPALINYWAIYCAPCIAEMPELSGLKTKYGNKMHFIALTENTCRDDDLIGFLKKHPFNFHILQNAEAYKRTLKISVIPRNIFIDQNGYIRYIQGNFPYTAFDIQKGIKKFDENNYFVQIIERLINQGNVN